jgi:hypothetical protein
MLRRSAFASKRDRRFGRKIAEKPATFGVFCATLTRLFHKR